LAKKHNENKNVDDENKAKSPKKTPTLEMPSDELKKTDKSLPLPH